MGILDPDGKGMEEFSLPKSSLPVSTSDYHPPVPSPLLNDRYLVRNQRPVGTSQITFDRIVTTCELYYRSTRQLPSIAQIMQELPLNQKAIVKVLASREFANEMAMRGIRWTSNPRLLNEVTPEQGLALAILTDPSSKRSFKEKLESAGISYSVFRNWLQQPVFKKRIELISENMLQDHIGDIHTALMSKAVDGDINAIKLAYEISGRHDPAKQQMVDLGRIVGLLLEVITRQVRDPILLMSIQRDFDIVLSGKEPRSIEQLPMNYPGEVISGPAQESGPTGNSLENRAAVGQASNSNASKKVNFTDDIYAPKEGFFDFEKE